MSKAKKINKILIWNLYLNVIGILGLAFFRFTYNESSDFILVFGLILMAIFVLYGLINAPHSRAFLKLAAGFNYYSLIALLLIALYHSTDWFDSLEKSAIISLMMLAIPVFGIISIGIVLNIWHSNKK